MEELNLTTGSVNESVSLLGEKLRAKFLSASSVCVCVFEPVCVLMVSVSMSDRRELAERITSH